MIKIRPIRASDAERYRSILERTTSTKRTATAASLGSSIRLIHKRFAGSSSRGLTCSGSSQSRTTERLERRMRACLGPIPPNWLSSSPATTPHNKRTSERSQRSEILATER
jgi:hypothetical protein